MCVEAGRLPEAAGLVTDLLELSERHGIATFRLTGTTQLATIRALTALNDTGTAVVRLTDHISALTALLDEWRARGVNLYRSYFDGVLARLLTVAGEPELARSRLDTALRLAEDTGMHFYDAELLRFRAHAHTDVDARKADLADAIDLAQRQGAPLFELRAALDDFGFSGEPARAAVSKALSRIAPDSAFPERQRAAASGWT